LNTQVCRASREGNEVFKHPLQVREELQQPRWGDQMLVLSRKPGEKIVIGDSVTITIVRIGPNTVRLGIEAPRDMNIVRQELCEIELTATEQSGNE
jgi:carbon storage regulator